MTEKNGQRYLVAFDVGVFGYVAPTELRLCLDQRHLALDAHRALPNDERHRELRSFLRDYLATLPYRSLLPLDRKLLDTEYTVSLQGGWIKGVRVLRNDASLLLFDFPVNRSGKRKFASSFFIPCQIELRPTASLSSR